MNFVKKFCIKNNRILSLGCRDYHITSVNRCKSEPVNLAYNSYESIDNDSNEGPVVIMHGMLGSKQNWKRSVDHF